MIARLLLLLSFFLTHFCAAAQLQDSFYIRRYTTDNGMPSNGVKGIAWDEKNSFLWIATEAGISRFNGLEFKNFSKSNTPFIASERILFMQSSFNGSIFSSDINGNVFAVNKNSLSLLGQSPYDHQNNIHNGHLRHLISVSAGYYKKNKPTLDTLTRLVPYIKPFTVSDSSFYFLRNKKLFFFNGLHDLPVALSDTNAAKILFKIDTIVFYVTGKNTVYKLNAGGHALATPVPVYGNTPFLKPGGSRFFWESGMAAPLVVDKENVWQLKYDGTKIVSSLVCNVFPSDAFINTIRYSEKNGLLFIGTDSKGIIVISKNQVAPVKKKDIFPSERNAYYAQVELANGNILTNEGHVIGNAPDNTNGVLPIAGKFNFNVYRTADSVLWYSKFSNILPGRTILFSYDYKTKKTTSYEKINIIQQFGLALSGGKVYIATGFGFGYLDTDSIHYLYKFPEEKRGDAVPFDMKETEPGVFVSAVCNSLLRYNIHTHVQDTILKTDGYCVRSLWQYKNYLFIGTYGKGYFIYSNGVIKPMPLDKNNFLLYTHCFQPDELGFLWLSTNRGLLKASLTDILYAFEHNSSVYYHYFGKNDGMDITEMNGGCAPCALELRNSTLSFPTMDGLLWVNPQTAAPLLPDGEIFIDDIIIDGNPVTPPLQNGVISLPSTISEIIIRPGFTAWCNKENIYLDYQLNDTLVWKRVNTDANTQILFTNLPAGKYTLRLRKLNGFGINNYSYKEIRFTIARPWYNTWWFYLLCIFALISFVFLFGKLRTHQFEIRQKKLEAQVAEKTKELQQKNEVLEKNNTIKTRLISIISHDIVTPLKFLTVAGKNLLEKRAVMSEALQEETIKEMTGTSQELQLLSTNILNWIKYQNENRRLAKEQFNVHDMVNHVFGLLQSLAKQKHLQLKNEVPPEQLLYQYLEPLRILIYNLVSNAINFSEKGAVTISCSSAGETLTITVTDEGVGMTAEQIQNIMADQFIISSANIDNRKGNGLGYLIIKDLLKMMGASFTIKSRKEYGSAISVIIPV